MSQFQDNDPTAEQRKADHIDLAFKSQVDKAHADARFYYEPLLEPHPDDSADLSLTFAGRKLNFPLWVSSMTGGTEMASHINRNLARMCREFGMGMGLGSCRSLLWSDERLDDFNMRPVIGPDLPLYANLGIAQVAELLEHRQERIINEVLQKLDADGLIIHVNPLQEWMQPEGDVIRQAPIETISELVDALPIKVIVKEVGQGMGPASLRELLKLPIQAIELAAHGGTNFTRLELLRATGEAGDAYAQMAMVGHSAGEMVSFINDIVAEIGEARMCNEVIISGGIKGFLDGYYLMNKLTLPSVYGHASVFLKYARKDYEGLREFARYQLEGLKLANACLRVR